MAPRRAASGGDLAWIPGLTGLRGLAALAVVVYHAHFEFHYEAGNAAWPLARFGWIGVDVFFVLSGYLLTRLLLRSFDDGAGLDRRLMGRYMVRRWTRIAPAFYFSIPLALALGGHWRVLVDEPHVLWTHLFFLHNVDVASFVAINRLYWTLAIEMQFYLLLPILVWAMRRWGAVIPLGMASLGLAVRWLLYTPETGLWAAYSMPAFLPHFAVGLWLAVLGHTGRPARSHQRWLVPAVAGAAAAGLLLVLRLGLPGDDPSQAIGSLSRNVLVRPLAAVFIGVLVWAVARPGPVGDLLSSRPLAWLGDSSYSLYLVHVPVILLLRDVPVLWDAGPFVYAAAAIGASLIAGGLFWGAVERPAMRWRKARLPRQARDDMPASTTKPARAS